MENTINKIYYLAMNTTETVETKQIKIYIGTTKNVNADIKKLRYNLNESLKVQGENPKDYKIVHSGLSLDEMFKFHRNIMKNAPKGTTTDIVNRQYYILEAYHWYIMMHPLMEETEETIM